MANGRNVLVTWVDADPADGTFELARERQQGSTWVERTVITSESATLTDSVGPGVYRYQVRSITAAGSSAFTTYALVTVNEVAPTAPTGLQVADLGTGGSARLTWNDTSLNETGFEIVREQQSGASWIGTTQINAAANATTIDDNPGVGTFRYHIRAINSAGNSEYSAWVIPTIADIPPDPMAGLAVTDLGNRSQVQLTWLDHSDNESGFEIVRQTQQGSQWVNSITLSAAADQTSMIDAPGLGTHRYRGRAVNGVGASTYTAYVTAQVLEIPPDAPSSPTASDLGDGSQVRVSWTDNSTNETGFEVLRETQSGSSWNGATTLNSGANTTTITDAPGVGTFRYRVRAVNSAGNSAYTTNTQVTVAVVAPSAPSGTAVSIVNGTQARVTWSDNSSNESTFEVARETQSGSTWGSRQVYSSPANTTAYTDTPGPGTHRYQVRAGVGSAFSSWTSFATVTIAGVPAAPSGLSVIDGGSGVAQVTWSDNSNNETSFELERNPSFGSPSTRTVSANVTGFTETPGLDTVSYRVRALNAAGGSAFTAWVTATIAAGTPQGGGGGTNGDYDANGYYVGRPSAESRTIYVSASEGNNGNDGLTPSTPVRTIAAGVGLLRDRMPDFLYLKRGDTWNENFPTWRKSGRSATEPMVVTTYGNSPNRPLLIVPTGLTGFLRTVGSSAPPSVDNIVISGVELTPEGNPSSEGITWLDPGQNVTFEDLYIHGFTHGITMQGYTGRINGVTIRRCIIADNRPTGSAHSEGMYCSQIDNFLLEENIFDHNGWSRTNNDATIYNHNVYIQPDCTNVTFRRNFVSDGSSHGLQLRCGGIIEDNIFSRNAIAIMIGSRDNPDPLGITAAIRGNVILEGRDMNSSNPRGWGIELLNVNASGAIVESNIFAHSISNDPNFAINIDGTVGIGCRNATVRNNVVYDWHGPIQAYAPNNGRVSNGHLVENNVIVDTSSSFAFSQLVNTFSTTSSVIRFNGNKYNDAGPADRWFDIAGELYSYQQWLSQTGETGSSNATINFSDPSRTLGTYQATQGSGNTHDAFMTAIKARSRGNPLNNYSIDTLLNYFRQGYTVTP